VAQKSNFLGKKTVKWETIQHGVSVLKLWSGDQYPQVAIFQFTADAYKRVRTNLSGFLNKVRIFGKAVKVQDQSGPGVAMTDPNHQPDDSVMLVVTHSKTSRSAWVVISGNPGLETPELEIYARGAALPPR
jgi:hypothetical protein